MLSKWEAASKKETPEVKARYQLEIETTEAKLSHLRSKMVEEVSQQTLMGMCEKGPPKGW